MNVSTFHQPVSVSVDWGSPVLSDQIGPGLKQFLILQLQRSRTAILTTVSRFSRMFLEKPDTKAAAFFPNPLISSLNKVHFPCFLNSVLYLEMRSCLCTKSVSCCSPITEKVISNFSLEDYLLLTNHLEPKYCKHASYSVLLWPKFLLLYLIPQIRLCVRDW